MVSASTPNVTMFSMLRILYEGWMFLFVTFTEQPNYHFASKDASSLITLHIGRILSRPSISNQVVIQLGRKLTLCRW